MELNKYLYLWMEFDNYYRKSEKRFHNPEEFTDFIKWLARLEREEHIYSKKDMETGVVHIKTLVNQIPTPCVIKCNQDKSYGYSHTRTFTKENGEEVLILPEGEWELEISHGPAYHKQRKQITIHANENIELVVHIDNMINMQERGWYAGELHHHSIFSSPLYGGTDAVVESPSKVRLAMQAAGCDFGALSDHHHILNHESWKQEKREGFLPMISKEISTSNGHVMALSVPEDIVYQIPAEEDRSAEVLKQEFENIFQRIQAQGGVAQVNHPYTGSKSTSFPEEFQDLWNTLDTMEIWNGDHPHLPGTGNHKAFRLWLRLLQSGIDIKGTAGSDTHYILVNQYEESKQIIHRIMKLIDSDMIQEMPDIQERLEILQEMWKNSYQIMTDWVWKSLGTAGVVNYVHVDKEPTKEAILHNIKEGNSFITNGPLLLCDIETLDETEKKLVVNVWSEEPIHTIICYFSEGEEVILELDGGDEGYHKRGQYPLCSSKSEWVICTCMEDCTNMAITNPIYY